jgi:hypothetical protein
MFRGIPGVALLAACFVAVPLTAANIVLNPGFEDGAAVCSSAAACNAIEGPWIFTAAASGTDFGVDNSDPNSGTYEAYFAGTTEGSYDTIGQTLSTVNGQTYTLSFWLDTHFNHSDADFQVLWNGAEVYDDPAGTGSTNQFPYTQIVISSLLATGSSTALTFEGFNVPSADYFDDVSVTPASGVPEPATWILTCFGVVVLAGRRLLTR